MNPLNQDYSGTAAETSRNAYRINQGTNDDNSQSDPYPEAVIFHNQTTRNSGPEDGHDMVTRVHEEVTYCSPVHFQKSRKVTALPVNRNSAAKIPMRRSKRTKSCWPFSSWQKKILQISITISTEFIKCKKRSRQRCPHLTGNLKSLNSRS